MVHVTKSFVQNYEMQRKKLTENERILNDLDCFNLKWHKSRLIWCQILKRTMDMIQFFFFIFFRFQWLAHTLCALEIKNVIPVIIIMISHYKNQNGHSESVNHVHVILNMMQLFMIE